LYLIIRFFRSARREYDAGRACSNAPKSAFIREEHLSKSKFAETVLVVGGGVGGMAAAIRLREAGYNVDLVDIDPKWGVYGTGITLSMLTMRALCDLGFAEQLMAQGRCYDGFTLCDAKGKVLRQLTSPRLYSETVPAEGGVLRPVLHAMLKSRVLALGAKVRTGVSMETLDQRASHVDVRFTDKTEGRYDLVIGADGLFSSTRGLIFPGAPKPRFTGQACWRALFPIPQGWTCGRMFLGDKVKLGFTLCAPDKMYLYLLEHVPGNPWRKPENMPDLLRGLMQGFGGEAAQIREAIDDGVSIVYRPLESILLSDTWNIGRVVLIGDAAHATTPHLGSGAGAAVEDAIVLVEELGRAETLEKGLSAFEAKRIPRAEMVVNNSLRIGELEMNGAPMQEQAALMGESMHAIAAPYR
jgi:2-polyprenyl-6-methoxyphenol hydroxylase-like FAD-dependent oxidoreductase